MKLTCNISKKIQVQLNSSNISRFSNEACLEMCKLLSNIYISICMFIYNHANGNLLKARR